MIAASSIRELTTPGDAHPRKQPHLSSTSGLVRAGNYLYLVADDEHHLGVLDERQLTDGDVHLHRIFEGDLPDDKMERKRRKPDMESIVLLPAHSPFALSSSKDLHDGERASTSSARTGKGDRTEHGALLVLGSGSKKKRERGALVPLHGDGAISGAPQVIDLSAFYAPLHREFADLNIEGALLLQGSLRLLQRANAGQGSRNACIDYPMGDVVRWLASPASVELPQHRIVQMELPSIDGVPLGFTDGAALAGGGWIFSAVAEITDDSFRDGDCAGSALGWVDAQGQLTRLEWLEGAPKVEGIAFADDGSLLMVTDADDPSTASKLLRAAL